MTDALERGPIVRQITGVEGLERIGRGEPLRQRGIDEQPDRRRVPLIEHQHLFVGARVAYQLRQALAR